MSVKCVWFESKKCVIIAWQMQFDGTMFDSKMTPFREEVKIKAVSSKPASKLSNVMSWLRDWGCMLQ